MNLLKALVIITILFVSSSGASASTIGLVNNITKETQKAGSKDKQNKIAISSEPSSLSESDINIIVTPTISNSNLLPSKSEPLVTNKGNQASNEKISELQSKIDELDELVKNNNKQLLTVEKLYKEQKEWNKTFIGWVGGGLGFFSVVFGLIAFVISRRSQESADLAFQSIKVAADSTQEKLKDISKFRQEVDDFKKDIKDSRKTIQRFEEFSIAIDLDLAILVNSESKLSSINFLITDYRQSSDIKLQKRLKDSLGPLIEIRRKLEEHLLHLKKPQFDGVKPELRKTIKEHIFRNLLIQSLVIKDLESPSRAIEILTDAEKFCDRNKQRALVYYNKACYYSLLGVLSSSSKCLAKAIDLSPSLRDSANEDSDLASLRSNAKLFEKALFGDNDD
ncbi:TPR end-of-group domain-containing protein [Pseudoalteromonas gelatinilytica]|uniref:Uncharacterized protein n=1 Tax=Pseudoalteromonas gelatinilytica TaxID=1703256 RepID=A0ABQ1UFM6_9GAMM|nr:hypothetical protein [Pseudoalteromonas profundi]GGF15647.1 hypothetical protein GCM10008027_45510 [Pseudoalteromonas profundi]